MREILFRGKRLDNGEWVVGHLCENYLRVGDTCICCTVELRFYPVYPDTVGQYTGLGDKNGKPIFEGDIIKIPDDYDEFGMNAGEVYEVYFCCGGFRLKPKYSKSRGYYLEDDKTVEVIGNIHDNPEMLNGGADNA